MKRIFTLLVLACQVADIIAQNCNALDQSFGSSGQQIGLTSNIWLNSKNIIVQPDNKILQFGTNSQNYNSHFSIVRYNSDGSVDKSFGQNGVVLTSLSPYEYATYGALQSDKKILVAGNTSWREFVILRYNDNGTPDNSFGIGGKVTASIGDQNNFGNGLAVDGNGKILAVGSTPSTNSCQVDQWGNPFCPNRFTVFRFRSDGTRDSSFGQAGKVITLVGPDSAGVASSVNVQADGKIIVAGSYLYGLAYDDYYGYYYYTSSHFVMVRYNSDGSVDSSFGKNGVVADASELQGNSAISLQADGKILITGYGGHPFQIERYNVDGSLDSNFGSGGKQFNSFSSWANSVLVLPNGKIAVAGATTSDFLIARLNTDGSFDTTFNGHGKVLIHVGPQGSYDDATGIALQAGHLIVGGASNYYSGNNNVYNQLVTRLLDSVTGLPVSITPHGTLTPCEGTTVKLVVNQKGTIQWFQDGIAIPGATDTLYYAYSNGSYSVSVQNSQGCGQSDPVTISVNGMSIVITPSSSLNFCEGDSVKLTSSQSGTLQWYRDGIPIGGATDSVYKAISSGFYYVRVQNGNGCGVSSGVYVNVNPVKPSITWDGTYLRTTNSNYHYQWYLNGDSIPAANNYFFKPTQSGIYKVVIEDYKCNGTSDEFNIDCNVVAIPKPSITWNGAQLNTTPGYINYQWYLNGDTISGAHNYSFTPADTGIYKVVITGNIGCQDSSQDFTLGCNLIGPPQPPINWNGTQMSTTAGYAHYQWYLYDTAINGATSDTYTPVQLGEYKVTVGDANNCTNTSDIFHHEVTGVRDIPIADTRLRYYPNPARTVLNIDVSQVSGRKVIAELYDLAGRKLTQQLLKQGQNLLPVQGYSSGLYQLIIRVGSEKISLKVIVIRD